MKEQHLTMAVLVAVALAVLAGSFGCSDDRVSASRMVEDPPTPEAEVVPPPPQDRPVKPAAEVAAERTEWPPDVESEAFAAKAAQDRKEFLELKARMEEGIARKEATAELLGQINELMDDLSQRYTKMETAEFVLFLILRNAGMLSFEIDELCRRLGVPSSRRKHVLLAIENWEEIERISRGDPIAATAVKEFSSVLDHHQFSDKQDAERQRMLSILTRRIEDIAFKKKQNEVRIRPNSWAVYERLRERDRDSMDRIRDEIDVAEIADGRDVAKAIEASRELNAEIKIAMLFGHDGVAPEIPDGAVRTADPDLVEAQQPPVLTEEQKADEERKAKKRAEWIERMSRTYLTGEKLRERLQGLGFDEQEVQEMVREIAKQREAKRSR